MPICGDKPLNTGEEVMAMSLDREQLSPLDATYLQLKAAEDEVMRLYLDAKEVRESCPPGVAGQVKDWVFDCIVSLDMAKKRLTQLKRLSLRDR